MRPPLMTQDRNCGGCALCCLFFAVPETGKPTGTWCPDCTGSGCGIHPTRPQSCRNFQCFWLLEAGIPDDMRPDRVGAVVSFNEDHASAVVHVDPDRPDALAVSPGAELLSAVLGAFDPVFVVCGEERVMLRGRPAGSD